MSVRTATYSTQDARFSPTPVPVSPISGNYQILSPTSHPQLGRIQETAHVHLNHSRSAPVFPQVHPTLPRPHSRSFDVDVQRQMEMNHYQQTQPRPQSVQSPTGMHCYHAPQQQGQMLPLEMNHYQQAQLRSYSVQSPRAMQHNYQAPQLPQQQGQMSPYPGTDFGPHSGYGQNSQPTYFRFPQGCYPQPRFRNSGEAQQFFANCAIQQAVHSPMISNQPVNVTELRATISSPVSPPPGLGYSQISPVNQMQAPRNIQPPTHSPELAASHELAGSILEHLELAPRRIQQPTRSPELAASHELAGSILEYLDI